MSSSDSNDGPRRVAADTDAGASFARLNRLYSMAREINKCILRGHDEAALFASACRIAVEIGGFRFAWVGLVTADAKRVEPVSRWGHEAGYLDGIRIDVGDTEHGRGPIGSAVREGRAVVFNDIRADSAFFPWLEGACARGYASCGAFPLQRAGRVVGALNVYSDTPGVFDDEQVTILHGLADDLSFALDLLDREEQRRAAELAMRRSEERYRSVFEQAFEGIFIVDADRAIVDANESACSMLGYTLAETLALHAEDVVHHDDMAHAPLRFHTIPPGGVIVSERRFVRKDGSVIHAELTTKALHDGNYQVVIRDVTERKQVQTQLLLADRLSSLGRLAAGVAHEINNPLAYVMLNLELLGSRLRKPHSLEDPTAHAQALESVTDAYDGAERMRRIVRALSTFGRGDEERVGPVDVNGVLDSAVEIASMQIRHRARLTRSYEAEGAASANAFRLGQVFVNLLVNAADALRDGDASNEIVLRTRTRTDGYLVVEVEDNGVGIPPKLQARIFDPFFTTKTIGKGTGLGLAVCHAIVTSFGGEIGCESAPSRGTIFRVALRPAREPTSSAPVPRVASEAPAAAAQGRVLVVDDDAQVAKVLAEALQGHEVVVVGGGREALERCRVETFDCILCDVMMPDVSGVDVHDELRREGRGLDARIVFVTGGAVTEVARVALACLPNHVLEKPVDLAELRSVVAAVVAEAQRGPAATFGAVGPYAAV